MKTVRIGIVVLGLFLNGGASAEEPRGNTVWDGFSGFLQPDWERDFSASVGVKVWVNEWTRSTFFSSTVFADDVIDQLGGSGFIAASVSSGSAQTQTSEGVEPTPIPQLSVRYKWLVLSGSYYPETEFEFRTTADTSTITQVQNFSGIGRRTTQVTFFNATTAEREEWDAGLGILILPNVAILGGYKEIDQDIRFVFTADEIVTDNLFGTTESRGLPVGTSSSDIEIKGPTIGIAGSVPIARGFGLYGSYAHGFMDIDFTDDSDGDADYDVAELGFTYTHGTKELIPFVPLSAATVYAGYRWQHIETDFSDVPNTEDRTDTTRGFVAGVNLSF